MGKYIVYACRKVFNGTLRPTVNAVLDYESIVAFLAQFESERKTLMD